MGGPRGALPWCWQSEPAKPGQHLQATAASTFCLTRYTGLWATRYLEEDTGSATQGAAAGTGPVATPARPLT